MPQNRTRLNAPAALTIFPQVSNSQLLSYIDIDLTAVASAKPPSPALTFSKHPSHNGCMAKVLSSRQAAALLDVSAPTILRWVRSGVLPGKLVGTRKRVRVLESDCYALRASWVVHSDFKMAAAGDRE